MNSQQIRRPAYWNKLTDEEKNEWRSLYGLPAEPQTTEEPSAAVPEAEPQVKSGGVTLAIAAVFVVVAVITVLGVYITTEAANRSEREFQKLVNQIEQTRLVESNSEIQRSSVPQPSVENMPTEYDRAVLDSADKILSKRALNNGLIEDLVQLRFELNRAVGKFIEAAVAHPDLDKGSAALESQFLDDGLAKIAHLENQISAVSMENHKLKLEWDWIRRRLPPDIRFSEPEFYKCRLGTNWNIQTH